MEQTLVLLKPDAIRRKLAGALISRFEAKNLQIKALKMLQPSRDLAERHYEVHRGKPFFDGVVEFMTSGPVVAMVLEGEEAVEIARQMIGALNPLDAQPGSIRGDYALSVRKNLVHGSDSRQSAEREIGVWFDSKEICL